MPPLTNFVISRIPPMKPPGGESLTGVKRDDDSLMKVIFTFKDEIKKIIL